MFIYYDFKKETETNQFCSNVNLIRLAKKRNEILVVICQWKDIYCLASVVDVVEKAILLELFRPLRIRRGRP